MWLVFIRIFLSYYMKSEINIDIHLIKQQISYANEGPTWVFIMIWFHNHPPIYNQYYLHYFTLTAFSLCLSLSLALSLSQSFYIKTISCVLYIDHSWFEITSCWNITLLSSLSVRLFKCSPGQRNCPTWYHAISRQIMFIRTSPLADVSSIVMIKAGKYVKIFLFDFII